MGYLTDKGIPIPFGWEGNNPPQHLLAFAQRLADVFSGHTYAEITAMSGADLWEGRVLFQSDTGTARPWKGLYRYNGLTANWAALVPTGPPTNYDPQMSMLTTPPSGTAITEYGRYSRFGCLVLGCSFHTIPASGYVNGSGPLLMTLPVPPANSDAMDGGIGVARLTDASAAGMTYTFVPTGSFAPPDQRVQFSYGGTSVVAGAGFPITIAASDTLATMFMYEAAEV